MYSHVRGGGKRTNILELCSLAPPTSSNHGLLEENTSVGYNTLAVGTNSSFNHKAGTSAELTQSSSELTLLQLLQQ